ncbi:MAG: hypothetical protein AB7R87_24865 [Parvibaculaceae bacterium]
MDRIVTDLHVGPGSAVGRAFAGLRRRGFIVFADATQVSLYWVNGNRLTAYQLMALAVMRNVPLGKRR